MRMGMSFITFVLHICAGRRSVAYLLIWNLKYTPRLVLSLLYFSPQNIASEKFSLYVAMNKIMKLYVKSHATMGLLHLGRGLMNTSSGALAAVH